MHILWVFKLVRNKDTWVFFLHLLRFCNAFFHAFTNIEFIMDQDQLCPVLADQKAPFTADRIRHDDNDFISFHGTNQCQSNSLVAACRLDNNRIRF